VSDPRMLADEFPMLVLREASAAKDVTRDF
jgi:hypothetical protein